jgi:hypothetical protein
MGKSPQQHRHQHDSVSTSRHDQRLLGNTVTAGLNIYIVTSQITTSAPSPA